MTVADVLRLLAVTTKTGRLQLESDAARGVVWVREGKVTAVSPADPRQETSPVEFLFWVTVSGDGWFEFDVEDDVPDSAEPLDVEALVGSVDALAREWDELHRVVPSLGHRVGLVERLPGPSVTIDAAVWPAVRAAAAEPQVHDLGSRFGLGDLDTLRAVRDLVSTGVVEVRPPPQDDPGPPPPRPVRTPPVPALG